MIHVDCFLDGICVVSEDIFFDDNNTNVVVKLLEVLSKHKFNHCVIDVLEKVYE